MSALRLTTPLMRGVQVLSAQQLLAGNGSRFGNYRPGPADGEYGERTAAAVRRAKYWLGYPKDKIDGYFGPTLRLRLTGARGLPPAHRLRRRARLKRAGETPMRVRAYRAAVGQLGVKESPPDSNRVKFSAWYGLVGPWCAMFVTWAYVQAGSKTAFWRGSRYAYTPYMTADARAGRHALRALDAGEVKQGDVVMFDWGTAGRDVSAYATDHVGIFEKWLDVRAGTFSCIEGNTSLTNQSNGGEVMRRTRYASQVEAFVRVEV